MSIITQQYGLIPIRKDGQVATTGNVSTSGSGGAGGGGTTGTIYSGGTNICLGTGTTITINVCGKVASACNSDTVNNHTENNLSVQNSVCFNGMTSGLFGNACVARAQLSCTSCSASYAVAAGSVTGGLNGGDSGSGLNYATKWCSHSGVTASRYYDNGTTCACINNNFVAPKFLENGTCLASLYLGVSACASDSNKLGTHPILFFLNTGTTITNATCFNGMTSGLYGNACVAISQLSCTSCTAAYATASGGVTGGVQGAQNGTYNNYLTKWCANACITFSSFTDDGTSASVSINLCAPKFIENGTCLASTYLGIGATANNALCLGGSLASAYAPLATPTFTSCITVTTCGFAVDWISSSDKKLKENIAPISNALSTVQKLCGVCFNMCNDSTKKPKIGLIAQEVLPILPEVVTTDNEFMGISYGHIVPILIESIKTLKSEVDQLKLDWNYYRNYNC